MNAHFKPFVAKASILLACVLTLPVTAEPATRLADNKAEPLYMSSGIDEAVQMLAKTAGKHQYVALGEQSHGAGNVFSFKREVVKTLHQDHGFDVLALESGLFDVDWLYRQFLTRQQSITKNAPGNIFYMYANSAELKPLFDYIERSHQTSRPLKLVGFDSQLTGGISAKFLVSELQQVLPPFNEQFNQQQWHTLAETIQKVLEINSTQPVNSEQFFADFDALITHAEKIEQRPDFWQRVLVGLKSQAQRQWQLADPRSHEMGHNLVWLAKQQPKAKMVIWAHTFHIQKDRASETANAGQVMLAEFGEQYYVSHFTGGTGEYVDFIDMQTKTVPEFKQGSVEYALNKAQCQVCVVNAEQLAQKHSDDEVLFVNYQLSVPVSTVAHKWDTLIHFASVTPSVQNQ